MQYDGYLRSGKPMFFPDFDYLEKFDLSVISTKDLLDIHSCIKYQVDYISVPYIEKKKDILEIKDLLSSKGRHIKILAKIQNKKALQNFDEILEEADGIIIARGYLGIDQKMSDLFLVQKYIIQKCRQIGKPAILST